MRTLGRCLFVTFELLLAAAIVAALAATTIGPRLFAYRAIVVRSGSMSPAIPTGSLVFYRPVQASQLKVGDVIVFPEPARPSTEITHRVYAISGGPTGRYLITKGDANAAPDGWRIPAASRGWKAVWSIPTVGYVLLAIASPYGRLLLLIVAILLALAVLREITQAPSRRRRGWSGRSRAAGSRSFLRRSR